MQHNIKVITHAQYVYIHVVQYIHKSVKTESGAHAPSKASLLILNQVFTMTAWRPPYTYWIAHFQNYKESLLNKNRYQNNQATLVNHSLEGSQWFVCVVHIGTTGVSKERNNMSMYT